MKKRVLSALMAVGLACSLVVTAFATADVSATPAPTAAVESQNTETESSDPAAEADPTETPAETPAATQEPTPAPEESTPAPSEEPASSATPEPTAEPSAAPDDTVTATPTPTPEGTAAPTPEATEEPAAAEPTAEPEATAEPAADNSADGIEYTAVLEQDGQALNVIVTAPADAFGEDVSLEVAAIEDTDETDAIAAELDESGLTYDGFAAMDISFKNAAGKEVEPSAPVTVRIELPDSIVDSGIDLNTLAVQHLAEDADGNVTAVEQVASVADGSIALSEEAQAAMEAQAAENAADDTATTDEAAGVAPMMLAANNAQTDATAEAAAVAEFEVSGFSTFTITWNASGSRSITATVNCYMVGGTELNTGIDDLTIGTGNEFRFNDENPKLQVTGYRLDHATMSYQHPSINGWGNVTWDDVQEVEGQIASFTALYDWNGRIYSYSYKDADDVSHDFEVRQVTDEGDWFGDDDVTYYTRVTFNLYYSEVDEEATQDLEIVSDIANTGSLRAEYNGTAIDLNDGRDYFYRWYRLDANDQYAEISGEIESSIEIYRDGARETYVAELWVMVEGASSRLARSEPYQVPYYDQLQNGGFSQPNVTGSNLQFTNDLYPELVWKTTGTGEGNKVGQDIEIINTEPESSDQGYNTASYNNYGLRGSRDDDYQLAELNCENAGALYQDVLTIPDLELYWQASHRPRTAGVAGLSNDSEDTMYVIIMDAEIAENNVTTQEQIQNIIDSATRQSIRNASDSRDQFTDNNNSVTVMMQYRVDGKQVTTPVTVWKLTSDVNTDWRGNEINYGWHDYGAKYQVPEGQYLTRFFFASGTTASGNLTIGNLIDRVSFDQYPPTEENMGRLVIVKNLDGIDETTVIPANTFTFTVGTQTVSLPTQDATPAQSQYWQVSLNLDAANYAIAETSNTWANMEYTYTGTTITVGTETITNTSREVIVREGYTTEITFTNAYQPQTGSLTIDKIVSGVESAAVAGETYTFSVTADDDVTGTLPEEFENDRTATVIVNGDGEATLDDLPAGTYTVTEQAPTNDVTSNGTSYYYAGNDVGTGKSATVTAGNAEKVEITNTYKPYKTIVITKLVDNSADPDDIGMGDTTKKFHFTTSIERDGESTIIQAGNNSPYQVELSAGNAEWQGTDGWEVAGYGLANGGKITIGKLKDTDKITIVETEANDDGYRSSYTVNNNTVESAWTDDTIEIDMSEVDTSENMVTVTVTNNRPVVPPTGLESNHTTPYGLMVGAAGVAGAALVGSVVVRRRRRRQE